MDAAEYAVHRQHLEAGRVLADDFRRTGIARPDAVGHLKALETVVQGAVIQATAMTSLETPDEITEEAFACEVFARRADELRAALDATAAKTYSDLVAAAPGVSSGDVEWWAIAVSAAGTLWWLGKLNWQGALVATILAAIFAGLAAYEALTIKTPEGRNVWRQTAGDVGDLLKYLLWGAAGLAFVGAGAAIYTALANRRQRRWAEHASAHGLPLPEAKETPT